jgi:hypothetical protein
MRPTYRRSARSARAGAGGAASRPRRGIALVVALLAIVTIGALIAGAVFASTEEFRVGRTALYEPQAMALAEKGLNESLARLRQSPQVLAANGDTARVPLAGAPANNFARLTRLTQRTYWLESQGTAGTALETRTVRRTGMALRYVTPQINFLAALTTNGETKIGGSSIINGNDQAPPNWTCPPSVAAKPGIVNASAANITTSGTAVVISGSPAIKIDAAASDTSTYFNYGEEANWKSLTAMANVRLPSSYNVKPEPSIVGGVCVAGLGNWGEPLRATPATACETRFPIIYSPGDLDLQGGRGQGILLVEGELKVSGGFQFYGPVIVRGRLTTQGTGGHFNGGVMAANVNLEQNVVLGDAVISYSKCAIDQALSMAGVQRPVARRAWARIY